MAQNTLSQPQPSQLKGLTTAEVNARIASGDTNDYKAEVNRTYWDIIRDNVFNLFNIVLFTLLFIVLALQDYGTVFFAGISVFMNSIVGTVQEANAKRRLDKLATLTLQKATVLRDGKTFEIPMSDVVKDDLLLLEPGAKAVVDGEVIKSDSLEMDESLLTGESDAIFKIPDDEIYSGSFCVAGTGVMRATRVGAESNINKLSEVAKEYKTVRTPTQKRLDIIVEVCVIIMLIFVPMIFINNLAVQQPALEELEAVRNAVVFVTTLVPQGLILTAILALSIGAIRISQRQTLVQKVNAVESLANVTVLCFDKTGTLTTNELAVDEILPLDDSDEATLHNNLADYLANLAHLNRTAQAVKDYIQQFETGTHRTKQREIPFTSGRKWGAILYDNETWVMGAPERLIPQDHDAYEHATNLSKEGKRVLALGKIDGQPNEENILDRMNPVAYIVMSDRVREDIQQTLQDLRNEDIRLKVISGDNLETVKAVARESGMGITKAYTGEVLDAMSDEDFKRAVQEANVFARVEPNTKRHIVAALQAQNEYVAMVGDGVNDVPSLKQAELAIVMNDGTQVSKEIADIVLLNNAMSTLPLAFAEGREITQTIFGTMKMFLIRGSYHIAFFVFATFLALPFPITPIQISWATFGTLNMPALVMTLGLIRPKFIENFRRDVLDQIVISGFVGSIMVVVVYVATFLGTGRDTEISRTIVTFYIMLFNMYNIMVVLGFDFYDFSTYRPLARSAGILLALGAFISWSFYMFPVRLEFTPISIFTHPAAFFLMIVSWLLSIVLVATLLKYRYFSNRFWALVEKDDKSFTEVMNANTAEAQQLNVKS